MKDEKINISSNNMLANSKRQEYFKKIKQTQKRLKFNNATYFYACSYLDQIINIVGGDSDKGFSGSRSTGSKKGANIDVLLIA